MLTMRTSYLVQYLTYEITFLSYDIVPKPKTITFLPEDHKKLAIFTYKNPKSNELREAFICRLGNASSAFHPSLGIETSTSQSSQAWLRLRLHPGHSTFMKPYGTDLEDAWKRVDM